MIEVETRTCRVCGVRKPIDRYYVAKNKYGKEYRRRICGQCVHRHRVPKRVPIEQVRPYVREIVHRCGGIKRAAGYLEVQEMQVRRWLGLSPQYQGKRKYWQKRMSRESAAYVLAKLRDLRSGRVYYEHVKGQKPKWFSVNNAEAQYKQKQRDRAKAAA